MKYRVNIDLANKTKRGLADIIDGQDNRLINKVGAFASLFQLDVSRYKKPVLVLKTEEPGSKQVLAFQHDKIESICFDMINHLINDCIAMGAEPLAVQDLIVCGKMKSDIVKRIVRSCSDACKKQGCVLTGGETTEQPGVVGESTYILGSSIVGVVDQENIVDGSKISKGNIIIGLASSGPHTNGYTMIRDLLQKNPSLANKKIGNTTFLESVLEPHFCYYSAIRELLEKKVILGMAHVTGGGIKENLNRILPENIDANIDLNEYQIPEVFKVIKKEGNISDQEMLRTFNLGIGFVLVLDEENKEIALKHLAGSGVSACLIGQTAPGTGIVSCAGALKW